MAGLPICTSAHGAERPPARVGFGLQQFGFADDKKAIMEEDYVIAMKFNSITIQLQTIVCIIVAVNAKYLHWAVL